MLHKLCEVPQGHHNKLKGVPSWYTLNFQGKHNDISWTSHKPVAPGS